MSADLPPLPDPVPSPGDRPAVPASSPPPKEPPLEHRHGLFGWWHRTPLYLRILGGCILGVGIGIGLRQLDALFRQYDPKTLIGSLQPLLWAEALATPSKLVLQLLGALAAPLILLAVVQALMHAVIPKGNGLKLMSLLILNTLMAIMIGLLVANTIRPGKWTKLEQLQKGEKAPEKKGLLNQFLDNVPKSILGPLSDGGKVISVIVIAVAFGIALRRHKEAKIANVADAVEVGFQVMLTILHWIIEIIPLAVFGIVASIVGKQGFGAFIGLGAFIVAVLVALALQMGYYLLQIRIWSWPRPLHVLRSMRDALVMAFSTASSTATMPVTYACLREKVGLRERSASLGALVGANFNNDGTALYEAMAALFISQLIGVELTLTQQLLVILTSVAASVGAAGIPEAGIVTMTLVFNAVGLPIEFIPILLTVDWFLDRCRTTINVMGDVNVSCLLDGRTREVREPDAEDRALAEIA
jgi:DAACS family dicarboxylate/amino acid:cation (Na+ or H+) symporter